jgi:hypothetical protein
MKTILISILMIFTVTVTATAMAENKKPKLSTDIKFDGHTVGGQVQAPFESLTEVENEKMIDQLIGVRKNFNDRIKKSNQLR